MATDMTIYLDDRPGQVAAVGRALADVDVNIDGFFALVVGGQGIMHVVVDDDDVTAAVRALADEDFEVRDEQEVVVTDCPDQPGALAERAERLSQAGVNLTVCYLDTGGRLVVGADDVEQARAAL